MFEAIEPHLRRLVGALAVAALIGLAAPTTAQVAVGPKAGTTGLGAELSFPVGSRLAARAQGAAGEYDEDFDTDRLTYDGEIDVSGALVTLDLHPFASGFRLSAGVYLHDTELRGTAPVADLLDAEGIQIPLFLTVDLGDVRGRGTYGSTAPYAGLGWGKSPRDRGWGFSLDVGVAFLDDPDVELELTAVALSDPLGVPFHEALDRAVADEERRLERELDDYRTFPVISLGASYRF